MPPVMSQPAANSSGRQYRPPIQIRPRRNHAPSLIRWRTTPGRIKQAKIAINTVRINFVTVTSGRRSEGAARSIALLRFDAKLFTVDYEVAAAIGSAADAVKDGERHHPDDGAQQGPGAVSRREAPRQQELDHVSVIRQNPLM